MNINKIIYGDKILYDATLCNVTKDSIKEGKKAHDKYGEQIIGELVNTNTYQPIDLSFFCTKDTRLDLVPFLDTSHTTNMSWMFYYCETPTSLDLLNFNTSNVTNMCSMFDGCKALTSLDLLNFNTSNVTNMRSMFDGCKALTSLDLSSFNTSKVTDMSYIFFSASGLTSLTLGAKWLSSDASSTASKLKLNLSSTGISGTYFTTFINNLPEITYGTGVKIYQTEDNGATAENIAAAKAKGWVVVTSTTA